MRVHLINPSHFSFGTGVMTPRWLYVLAAATPATYGIPILADEILEPLHPDIIEPGDIVGIGIHTGNALRGYEVGRLARQRGAQVVFGGIHATLYPDEAINLGGAHAVVQGDGDRIWAEALRDCAAGALKAIYAAGRIEPDAFLPARWDLLPRDRYLWATVQTVRGCPKHCSFCSVWRTDGQRPRQRASDTVVNEVVQLRRRGFRFVVLADDNFYPISLSDLRAAARNQDKSRLEQLTALREDRLTMLRRLALLPDDMVFFTQITMEAAEDPAFLDAMHRARIKGALVGIESVTPDGLKDVYKNFNMAGEALVERLRVFARHEVYVLGSFIFGLPSDRPATFETTVALAEQAQLAFAQFVPLTPLPGTLDFTRWEETMAANPVKIAGKPLARYWLIPPMQRPRVNCQHPLMSAEEIRRHTHAAWDRFYSVRRIWRRSRVAKSLRARLAFLLISKLYRQMYANTGIAADSARAGRAASWSRWIAKPCRRLFTAAPLPELEIPPSPEMADHLHKLPPG